MSPSVTASPCTRPAQITSPQNEYWKLLSNGQETHHSQDQENGGSITADNREFVDGRLKELNGQRKQLELRLAEPDRLEASQAEINSIVSDAPQFISRLEFILGNGLPQEKLRALRRCSERMHIDRPASLVRIEKRLVPGSHLLASREIRRILSPHPGASEHVGATGI